MNGEPNGGKQRTSGKRFLNVFAYILLFMCIWGYSTLLYHKDIPLDFYYVEITISTWFLSAGIGLFARKKWGYYLFKTFLYFLFLCFPIGTIISYKSLMYIKKNNIKSLFF